MLTTGFMYKHTYKFLQNYLRDRPRLDAEIE